MNVGGKSVPTASHPDQIAAALRDASDAVDTLRRLLDFPASRGPNSIRPTLRDLNVDAPNPVLTTAQVIELSDLSGPFDAALFEAETQDAIRSSTDDI